MTLYERPDYEKLHRQSLGHFPGRLKLAIELILLDQTHGEAFDNCFKAGDAHAVILGIVREAEKNPELARRIEKQWIHTALIPWPELPGHYPGIRDLNRFAASLRNEALRQKLAQLPLSSRGGVEKSRPGRGAEHSGLFRPVEGEPGKTPKAPKPLKRPDLQPKEWKVTALRECPSPESLMQMKCAEDAVRYWETHITKGEYYNPDCECTVVLTLTTRLRIRGHYLVSLGALNQTIAEPREVFRIAVMAAAHSVILMHNHPSGEPDPSEADRRATAALRSAGRILKIELMDHIITGGGGRHFSFREAGVLG